MCAAVSMPFLGRQFSQKKAMQIYWNCVRVFMVTTYNKGMDKPGKLANPARGQLDWENEIFLRPHSRLRIWPRERSPAVPSARTSN